VENGEGPPSPSRARQGRARSADGLRTCSALIAVSRNCQTASPPGLHPSPFVRGVPNPLLLAPQTARCACSRHKNVRRCTDALINCADSWTCFPWNRALKEAHSPCGRGLRGPSKFFRDFWIQVRVSGAARGSRAATNAHSVQKIGRLVLCMFCRALVSGFLEDTLIPQSFPLRGFCRGSKGLESGVADGHTPVSWITF
jgi:hypothetical protein